MFDEGEKELTIFIPKRARRRCADRKAAVATVRGRQAFSGVVNDEKKTGGSLEIVYKNNELIYMFLRAQRGRLNETLFVPVEGPFRPSRPVSPPPPSPTAPPTLSPSRWRLICRPSRRAAMTRYYENVNEKEDDVGNTVGALLGGTPDSRGPPGSPTNPATRP
ncbi:hypothetical protein KM043_015500 [Ampulex compressa]|nr:hypothetical protein KM043_015500 [Ampulex compressa]